MLNRAFSLSLEESDFSEDSMSLPGFIEPINLLCVRKSSASDRLSHFCQLCSKVVKKVVAKLSVLLGNCKIPVRTFEIFNLMRSLFTTHIGCFRRRNKNEKNNLPASQASAKFNTILSRIYKRKSDTNVSDANKCDSQMLLNS